MVKLKYYSYVRVFVAYLIIIIVICLSSQRLDNYIVIIFAENLRLQEHKRF